MVMMFTADKSKPLTVAVPVFTLFHAANILILMYVYDVLIA
jgi:hypothetical protein